MGVTALKKRFLPGFVLLVTNRASHAEDVGQRSQEICHDYSNDVIDTAIVELDAY